MLDNTEDNTEDSTNVSQTYKENIAFTNRVISYLQTNFKRDLERVCLIDYLRRLDRLLYFRDIDIMLVKETDGSWHVGWYIR